MCAVVFCPAISHAQARLPGEFPILFDARERIARPDLSGLARLRFLTSLDFPPFNFIDQSGRLSGFHVDLVREICAELDIEARCQIQALPFAELLKALEAGEGDAVVAGVAITSQLRQTFGVSRSFMLLPARFLANRQAVGDEAGVDALAGKSVGVVAGTTHEAMAKAFFPDLRLVPFPTRSDMLEALRDNRVAAVFSDGVQLSFWMSGSDARDCCAMMDGAYSSLRFLGEGLAILNRQSEPAVTQAIDHALLTLSRNGRLGEIYLRYFPNGLY